MKQPKLPTKPNKPKEPSKIILKRGYSDLEIRVDDITYTDESATLEINHVSLEKLISAYEKLKTNTNLKNISLRLQEFNCQFEWLEDIINPNYEKEMKIYSNKLKVYENKLLSYNKKLEDYKKKNSEYKKLLADIEYQKALKIVQSRGEK